MRSASEFHQGVIGASGEFLATVQKGEFDQRADGRDFSAEALDKAKHARGTESDLDLDADPVAVDAALAEDPLLAPLVAAAPGRRVRGCA